VNRDDIRMVQCSGGVRFLLESLRSTKISARFAGEDMALRDGGGYR